MDEKIATEVTETSSSPCLGEVIDQMWADLMRAHIESREDIFKRKHDPIRFTGPKMRVEIRKVRQ